MVMTNAEILEGVKLMFGICFMIAAVPLFLMWMEDRRW